MSNRLNRLQGLGVNPSPKQTQPEVLPIENEMPEPEMDETGFESIEEEELGSDDLKDIMSRLQSDTYWDLVKMPVKGSVISTFKHRANRTSKMVDRFVQAKLVPQFGMVLMNNRIPNGLYALLRVVLPHQQAAIKAEELKTEYLDKGHSEMDLIQVMTEMDLSASEGIGAVTDVLTRIGTYHPELAGFFKNMAPKFQKFVG